MKWHVTVKWTRKSHCRETLQVTRKKLVNTFLTLQCHEIRKLFGASSSRCATQWKTGDTIQCQMMHHIVASALFTCFTSSGAKNAAFSKQKLLLLVIIINFFAAENNLLPEMGLSRTVCVAPNVLSMHCTKHTQTNCCHWTPERFLFSPDWLKVCVCFSKMLFNF